MIKLYRSLCVLLLIVVHNYAHAQTCQGLTRFTTNSGTFEDGSGELNYDNSLECRWVIKPENGGPIRISFLSFETEASYDNLRIYEDTVLSSNLISELSGSGDVNSVVTGADSVYIVFDTDGSATRSGWEISYESGFVNAPPSISPLTVAIDEQALPGVYGTLEATDEDGDDLTFALVSGNEDGLWSLSDDGALSLLNGSRELDFETQASYSITVSVSDGIDVVEGVVTINVDDIDESLAPVIASQNFQLLENAPSDYQVGIVTAVDPSGEDLTFSHIGNTSGLVISSKGVIRVSSNLNFEASNAIDFEVGVSNGSYSSRATITVNLEDVSCGDETMTTNTGTFADGSNYAYYENNSDCSWLIQPESGGPIRLVFDEFNTEGGYDFVRIYAGSDDSGELLGSYSGGILPAHVLTGGNEVFVSFVSDGSYREDGWVITYETGVNSAPTLSEQTVSVLDTSLEGVVFTTLEAIDDDGDLITYEIVSGDTNDNFILNGETGELSLNGANLTSLVAGDSYSLSIQVSDAISSTTTTVTVNVINANDAGTPLIEDQSFSISENLMAVEWIGQIVASDGDNLTTSFSLLNEETDFSITEEGALYSESSFNFEDVSSYEVEVVVSNGVNTNQATITVNITDIGCAGTTFTANEGVVNDGSGRAKYDHNSSCEWLIAPENGGPITLTFNEFELESNYDNVYIYAGSDNSSELVAILTGSDLPDPITINAQSAFVEFTTDGSGHYSGWEFTYFSENEAPAIEEQTMSVSEDAASNFIIGTVLATDENELTYTIADASVANVFAIDAATGELSLLDDVSLDFESINSYVLSIEVTDGFLSASANVTIDVLNVNEAPIVSEATFSIEENSENGTSVGSVSAIDEDGDELLFSIIAGNTSGAFSVDDSGEITVANVDVLDFETTTSFTLTVEVSDGVLSSSVTVVINLLDVGDTVLGARSENAVALYPTIAETDLTLKLNNAKGQHLKVELVSVSGQTIKLLKNDVVEANFTEVFDVSGITSGMYLLRLNVEENLKVFKVIIK